MWTIPVAKLRQRLITSGIRVFSSSRNFTSAREARLLKWDEVRSHRRDRRNTWTSDMGIFRQTLEKTDITKTVFSQSEKQMLKNMQTPCICFKKLYFTPLVYVYVTHLLACLISVQWFNFLSIENLYHLALEIFVLRNFKEVFNSELLHRTFDIGLRSHHTLILPRSQPVRSRYFSYSLKVQHDHGTW